MSFIYNSKILFLILSLLGTSILLSWTGNFSTPENAFHSLLAAAATRDLDNFLECCDLESMTGEVVTPNTVEQIKNSLKNDPYRKEFIQKIFNYLNNNNFEILASTEISPEMHTLLMQNIKHEEKALVLFRKRNNLWKLSTLKPVKEQ